MNSPESVAAYIGEGPYKQPLKNVRVVSSGASILLSYVVRADSNIKTMADLKGKRVAIDRASYTTKQQNEMVLQAAGLDLKKDITPVPVAGVAELMGGVMDGRADAGWAPWAPVKSRRWQAGSEACDGFPLRADRTKLPQSCSRKKSQARASCRSRQARTPT